MQNKTAFNDLSPLAPPSSLFQEEAKLSRSLLLAEFRSMPNPFGTALENHLLERAGTRNTGEVIPWLIADMIGVERSKSVERLAAKWFLLHSYLLVIDDLLDEPLIENRPVLQIASGLCLQRALTGMFEVVPRAIQSCSTLNEYFATTAEAVRAELLGSRDSTAPNPSELCQRMPGFKLWALFLLHSEGRLVDFEAIAVMLDAFVNGFQLLDDLMDWEDDWRQGRNSFVLHETFSRLEKMGLRRAVNRMHFTSDELLAAMVVTASITDTLNLMNTYSESVVLKLKETGRSRSASYIEHRVLCNHMLATKLHPAMIASLPSDRLNQDWLSLLVKDEAVKTAINQLRVTMDKDFKMC